MDPQSQALIAALMGGQSNAQPSAIAPMPSPMQFSPQQLGYGPTPQAAQMPQNPYGGAPYQQNQQQIPGMYAQGMNPGQMGQ